MCASKITARVRTPLVLCEPVDDRVPADLLLAVAGDADVHGQCVLGGKRRRSLEQQVELALVVGDAARVQPLVADRRLERRALPPVERGRRLDVEVAVDEDGCGRVGIAGRPQLAERERPPVEVGQLGGAAGGADERAQPLARPPGRRPRGPDRR